MIRRINRITIMIIILSDELAVLTNTPRGCARGRVRERERFCWSEQIKMTLPIRRRAHMGQEKVEKKEKGKLGRGMCRDSLLEVEPSCPSFDFSE